MEEAPAEIIGNIAGHCKDGATLNALIRTSSEINEKVNAYPSQLYEHVKKHQPVKLAQELLTMIDPAELITYQLEKSDNDLLRAVEKRNLYNLKFKLGSLELYSFDFFIDRVTPGVTVKDTIRGKIFKVASILECDFVAFNDPNKCCIVRENLSDWVKVCKTKTKNGGMFSKPRDQAENDKFVILQFKPIIFDAIIKDLKVHIKEMCE